jgi:hypothetical protein
MVAARIVRQAAAIGNPPGRSDPAALRREISGGRLLPNAIVYSLKHPGLLIVSMLMAVPLNSSEQLRVSVSVF